MEIEVYYKHPPKYLSNFVVNAVHAYAGEELPKRLSRLPGRLCLCRYVPTGELVVRAYLGWRVVDSRGCASGDCEMQHYKVLHVYPFEICEDSIRLPELCNNCFACYVVDFIDGKCQMPQCAKPVTPQQAAPEVALHDHEFMCAFCDGIAVETDGGICERCLALEEMLN